MNDHFLGRNPSFLRFIKHVRMDLSYDNLQRVFVTLFELVKIKKEKLILHEEEIKGKGNIFSFVSMAAHSPPLNVEPVYIFISEQLSIHLVSDSIKFRQSPDSFESIQRMNFHILALQLVSVSSNQCFQVIFHSTICSKDVSFAIHLINKFTFL